MGFPYCKWSFFERPKIESNKGGEVCGCTWKCVSKIQKGSNPKWNQDTICFLGPLAFHHFHVQRRWFMLRFQCLRSLALGFGRLFIPVFDERQAFGPIPAQAVEKHQGWAGNKIRGWRRSIYRKLMFGGKWLFGHSSVDACENDHGHCPVGESLKDVALSLVIMTLVCSAAGYVLTRWSRQRLWEEKGNNSNPASSFNSRF